MTEQTNYDRVWVAGDLLLGGAHGRARGYEGRILRAWDQCVRKDDVVMLLGNLTSNRHAYWLNAIQEMPGVKKLLMGDTDRNRANWYKKYGFVSVTPISQYETMDVYLGKNDQGEAYYGKIMFTHLPPFPGVGAKVSPKFIGLMRKLEKSYDYGSMLLSIHSHTRGHGNATHRTQDVSMDVIGEQLVTVNQVLSHKFNWGYDSE